MKKLMIVFMGWMLVWGAENPVQGQECTEKPAAASMKRTEASAEALDINRLECFFHNDGTFGENPDTHMDGCFYPAGQREKSLIYTAGLWIVGIMDGEYASAVSCYGSEFQPGKILESGLADDPGRPEYRVYKYSQGDAIDPEALEQGCPDSVLGDQMLFCVFNDLKSNEGMWGGPVMGLEVQMTAFAYTSSGPLDETLFVKYRIINKGSQDISDAYAAFFFDADLGDSRDDLGGCDSLLGMTYFYNGDGYDEKYGNQPPAFGCDILQGPEDAQGIPLEMSSAFFFL